MKSINTIRVILLAGLIIAFGLVTTQAFAHFTGGHMMGQGYGDHMMRRGGHMMDGYGYGGHMWEDLTSEDRQKMVEQRQAFFDATKDIRQQISEKQRQLDTEYGRQQQDQSKIVALERELFDLGQQFEKKQYDHTADMKKRFGRKNNAWFCR